MKFLLEPDGILKYTSSDNSVISDKNLINEDVQIFDFTQDSLDNIHLVYLQKNGDLNYIIFNDEGKSESKIAKFDMQSNNYYQISILIVKDKLNIFYAFSNKINSSIYTLHHVVLNEKKQEMYNIVRLVSKKNNRSFVVDCDSSENIHMFYNTMSDSFSYIFYTYFNPYKNQWLQNPIMISKPEKKCEYPSTLVDSKDNIHVTWWEKSTDGLTLKYKKMNQTGKDLYKWMEIDIPIIIQEYPEANVYEENDYLYIKCTDTILISDDFGYHWNVFKESNSKEDEIGENNDADITVNIFDERIPLNEDIVITEAEEAIDTNLVLLEQIIEEQNKINENQIQFFEKQNQIIESQNQIIENQSKIIENQIQILENQNHVLGINNALSDILEDINLLKSKLEEIENLINNPPKSGLKKFFTTY